MADIFDGFDNLSDGDRTLIEVTIGAGILEKNRGNQVSLEDIYKASGGTIPFAAQIFAKIDDSGLMHDNDHKTTETNIAPQGFGYADGHQDLAMHDFLMLKHTIGLAVIDKMRGNPSTMVQIYEQLGGVEPVLKGCLERIDQTWAGHVPTRLNQVTGHG